MKVIPAVLIAALLLAGCSRNNDNEHTTATTIVPPPPQQTLSAEFREAIPTMFYRDALRGKKYDRAKPILVLDLPENETHREDEPVIINFTLVNAKLKGDGGEYRLRYMVDGEDMQWIDRQGQVWLWGWVLGKHTFRVELIGPDGWPARNGDCNVETREITIVR